MAGIDRRFLGQDENPVLDGLNQVIEISAGKIRAPHPPVEHQIAREHHPGLGEMIGPAARGMARRGQDFAGHAGQGQSPRSHGFPGKGRDLGQAHETALAKIGIEQHGVLAAGQHFRAEFLGQRGHAIEVVTMEMRE